MERVIAIHTKHWDAQDARIPQLRGLVAELQVIAGLGAAGARAHGDALRDWAVAHDASKELCEAGRVAGVVALAAVHESGAQLLGKQLQGEPKEHEDEHEEHQEHQEHQEKEDGDVQRARLLREGEERVDSGLQTARLCGFVLLHIDLCVLRARLRVRRGDAEGAEVDARTALFGPRSTGAGSADPHGVGAVRTAEPAGRERIELLGATAEECGYRWGEAAGRHALAEALLVRAGGELGATRFDAKVPQSVPEKVHRLVSEAQEQLQLCLGLRRHLQDRLLGETEQLACDLEAGRLPEYSVHGCGRAEEERGWGVPHGDATAPQVRSTEGRLISEAAQCLDALGVLYKALYFGVLSIGEHA